MTARSHSKAEIESYFARADAYAAQGKSDLAIADLRKAIDLKPKNVFDTMAPGAAKSKIRQFEERIPYGNAGSMRAGLPVRAPPPIPPLRPACILHAGSPAMAT